MPLLTRVITFYPSLYPLRKILVQHGTSHIIGAMLVLLYVGHESQAAYSYLCFEVLHRTLVDTARRTTLRFLILVSFHAMISNPQSKK